MKHFNLVVFSTIEAVAVVITIGKNGVPLTVLICLFNIHVHSVTTCFVFYSSHLYSYLSDAPHVCNFILRNKVDCITMPFQQIKA
jgi:hypothetical protein